MLALDFLIFKDIKQITVILQELFNIEGQGKVNSQKYLSPRKIQTESPKSSGEQLSHS